MKILQLNPAMVALLGYDSKKEVIGSYLLDYTRPEFHQDWFTLQTKLWDLHLPSFNLETCLKKKDGSIIWCSVTSTEIVKQHGGEIGATSKIGEGSVFWFTIPRKT